MSDLVLNPRAEIVIERDDRDALRSLTLRAPTRARGLLITRVTKTDPPAVFEVLLRVAEGKSVDVELDEASFARLEGIGLLVPAGSAPLPVSLEAPLGLTKGQTGAADRARLVVCPGLSSSEEAGAPEGSFVPAESVGRHRASVRGEALVTGFAKDVAWAWARQEGFSVATPVSLDEADRALFRRLSPGMPPPADLDDATIERLFQAGVLVDLEGEAARKAAFDEARKVGSQSFKRARFAIMKELFSPHLVAALRRYYRALVAEGHAGWDTRLGRNRYWQHNEPVARVFHGALTDLVSEIAGEPLKPSYAYFSSYKDRAKLVRHVDRDQCPVSISLLLDYDPEPSSTSPWPLCLDLEEGTLPIHQALGDGLIFDGTQIHHHRPALPEGHKSTSIFLHYVPASFQGSLD